ncbi:MAG: CoB--CoM heterodisulfide reductase iron-sulfur subunit B family protein [Thermoplasmata archaeon]|nr:MAG: CoB--CoM heterodisulfide reductase iron-sulfur subunit B family protein [Thermoplasmata archaeon]
MSLEYSLFLGCTTPVRCMNYEVSARNVCRALDINLIEIDDFSCCGYPTKMVDKLAYTALGAKNLCLAEQQGKDVVAFCPSCSATLQKTNQLLKEDVEYRNKVNEILKEVDMEFKGTITVKHISAALYNDLGIDKIKSKVNQSLDKLVVAPHYSCHSLRPSTLDGFSENPMHPVIMDQLIGLTGAKPLDYENKLQCCGAGLLFIEENTPADMTGEKLLNVRNAGADAITVDCPFCNIMYDEYQGTIGKQRQIEFNLPVLFITQLLGLAFKMDPKKELLLQKNQVKTKKLLKKLQL